MRGSSRRPIEVRIVALPTLEVMTSPGVATAAPKPSTTTADSTVTDDSGPLDSPRGVGWS